MVQTCVADLDGRGPLVRDEDVVHFGRRDADEAEQAGSQRIEDTAITVIDLAAVRQRGVERAARMTRSDVSSRPELDGFWIHLDCDALDDDLMPAVDYRLPDGLSWAELETVLRLALDSQRVGWPRGHHLQPDDRTAPSRSTSSAASSAPSPRALSHEATRRRGAVRR